MPHPTLHLTFCPVPPVRETISNSYCVSRIHRSQVTLVLMVLGMWDLAEHANPAVLAQQRNGIVAEAPFPNWSRHVCAALQPIIILLDTAPRFVANEFRIDKSKQEASSRSWQLVRLVGVLSWIGAALIFSFCLKSLTDRIFKDGWDLENSNWRESDGYVTLVLMYIQLGYPILSLLTIITLRYTHDKDGTPWRDKGQSYPAWVSTGKDAAYAFLDVVCKGGMALYVAGRAVYVVDNNDDPVFLAASR